MFVIVIYIRVCVCGICVYFFFKQKTAYEMRISDWSSDVCSSDLRDAGDVTAARLSRHDAALKRLARIEHVGHDAAPSGGAAQVIVDEATFVLPLEGVIDLAAEKARLQKAVAAAEKERDSLAGRLGNPAFVEKAKPEAVAQAREDHAARSAEAERRRAGLHRLG